MRKKVVTIMSVILVILIIIAVILGIADMKKVNEADTNVNGEVESGVEDSIFDDELAEEDGQELAQNETDPDTQEENATQEYPDLDKESANEEKENSDKKNSSNKNNKPNKPSSGKAPSLKEDGKLTYEEFHALDGDAQQKYMESFESMEDFFDWYNAAKKKYEKENPSIEVDGGAIDLDKIANE